MTSVVAFLFALLNAVPAVRDIFRQLVALENKANEAEAQSRLASKEALVDRAITDVLEHRKRMQSIPSAAQQQPAVGSTGGLLKGSGSGTGMGAGRTENYQQT
jgi:hypothetical protein